MHLEALGLPEEAALECPGDLALLHNYKHREINYRGCHCVSWPSKKNPLPAPVPPHCMLYSPGLFCHIGDEDKIIQFTFILSTSTYTTK